MRCSIWLLGIAVTVTSGCSVTQSEDIEDVATVNEELSVLDWSADTVMAFRSDSASEPAVAAANGIALSVYPQGYPADELTDLYWNIATSSSYAWSQYPTKLSPHATSTARPTLVAFNGYFYLFYASNVDQYMARFNPTTRAWTGSTRLPFDSRGAVAALAYNGALALVRSEPSNNQLFLRWMATDESFSAERPISYSTFATDPCQGGIIMNSTAAPAAPAGTTSSRILIGFNNEYATSTVALAAVGDCLYMAHRDNTSNTLVYNTYRGGSWGPKRTITSGLGGTAQVSATQPAMATFAGGLQLVHLGPGGNFTDVYWTILSNGTWSAPLTIPNHVSQGTPSIAPLGNRLLMVHQGAAVYYSGIGNTNLWSSTYLPTL